MVEDEKEEQGVVGCIPKIKFAVISIFTSIAFLLQGIRLQDYAIEMDGLGKERSSEKY